MRSTTRLFATASASLPLTPSQASAQLIPPLPLYRRLLRIHRSLPNEMRFMGDSYIKSEFRLTRSTDNPLHIIAFLSQWKQYLDELESSVDEQQNADGGGKGRSREIQWRGRRLNTEAFEKMSAEQVGQLYELMHATKDVWKSADQLQADALHADNQNKKAHPEQEGVGGTSDSSSPQ